MNKWSINKLRPGVLKIGAVSLTVFLMASAFAPFRSSESAWICLIPLIVLARYVQPKQAFKWGFVAGLVFWGINLYWLLMLIKTGGYALWVVLGWILLSAYCALYMGAFVSLIAYAFRWIGRDDPDISISQRGGFIIVPVAVITWVALEYLRSVLFTGFPWNALGVSQYRMLPIIQIAEWGGVYAVSAVIVLVNAALAVTLLRFVDVYKRIPISRFNAVLAVSLLVTALVGRWGYARTRNMADARPGDEQLNIAAVQPGIPQVRKWDESETMDVYLKLMRQTEEAKMLKSDLIVWPETAYPAGIDMSDSESYEGISRVALQGVPILAGVIEQEQRNGARVCYNTSVLFGVDGKPLDKYRKEHLVPFGEYLPLSGAIPVLNAFAPLGFTCLAGDGPTLFAHPDRNVLFSTLICFEDVFPEIARRAVKKGSRLLINQTNDAWFDDTAAHVQHASHCVFRCVENRVNAVRVTNTGVTCFIRKAGHLDKRTIEFLAKSMICKPASVSRFDVVEVRASDMQLTIYTRYGDLAFAIPCLVAALVFFGLVALAFKRDNESN